MSIIEKALKKGRDGTGSYDADDRSPPSGAASERLPGQARGADARPGAEPVTIDLLRLRESGIWPTAAMEEQLRGQYRRIKRPIVQNAVGRSAGQIPWGNLVAVTSSIEGEGKTFTSLNLALSLSQEVDCEVLLVDADMIRRRTSVLLGIEEQPGLAELLADQGSRVTDAILPTTIETLSVLPAGQPHALSTELITSARMETLLSQLAAGSQRRIVIFDSPPLLPSPEAVTIAGLTGQVALVVKSGATEQHLVVAAIEQLDPKKPVNLILNQSKQSHGSDYYGGYYGYAD